MRKSNLPLANRDRTWDGTQARRNLLDWATDDDGNLDKEKASWGFTYTRGDAENQDDYVSPFADIIDDEPHVVFRGVTAAIGRNDQVDDISESEREEGMTFLEGQRDRFDDEVDENEMASDTEMVQMFSTPILTAIPSAIITLGEEQSTISLFESGAERAELLRKVEAGEILAITFDAITFNYITDNANYYRFRTEDMPTFSSSFSGVPFLRDHDSRRIDSRDGTVISSALMPDGTFKMTVKLTTRKGMLALLEGQIDRFSIGFDYEKIICSICNENWFHCWHWPGADYDTEDGWVACFITFINPYGNELSAVNVPAVSGTGILQSLQKMKKKKKGDNLMSKKKEDEPTITEDATVAEELDTSTEQETSDGDVQQHTLAESIADHVLGIIGSPESMQELAQSLGLESLITELTSLSDRVAELESHNADLVSAMEILDRNVHVLSGEELVRDVNPRNSHRWAPLDLGLGTEAASAPPSNIRKPSTIKPIQGKALDSTMNATESEPVKPEYQESRKAHSAIQKYNSRIANNQ